MIAAYHYRASHKNSTATLTRLKPSEKPKCRVLIVEDTLDAVHSMAMLVRMMGHEVEFAKPMDPTVLERVLAGAQRGATDAGTTG